MSQETEKTPCQIKRLKGPKEELLALTSSLDQKLSLDGSLRAAGLTAFNFDHRYYLFGSLEGTTVKYYSTGDSEHPGLEVIKCRIFDLSRLDFLGITSTDEAIEKDIIATFHIETRKDLYTDSPTFTYDISKFLNVVTSRTDERIGDLLIHYLSQLKLNGFTLTHVDYQPSEHTSITLVKNNIKVIVNYYIADHIDNINNYHLD